MFNKALSQSLKLAAVKVQPEHQKGCKWYR
jgi:hypothetical protein